MGRILVRYRSMVDAPSWFYSRRATDWKMKMKLARELSDVGVELPSNLFYDVVFNAQYLLARIVPACLRKGFHNACVKVRSWILSRLHVAILISQGGDPPIPHGAKVIWETFFLDPQLGAVDPEFKRGGKNRWIQRLEKYGPQVSYISVRGRYSGALLTRMYPEFAEKVVDLGFVHDEYSIATEEMVRQKQYQQGCVELLFVGHLAKLKGIAPLLASCERLYAGGLRNFHLTIVSALLDGKVEIPNENWLTYFPALPHAEVLKLFSRSHIYIMPTFRDTYGLVFHEALANGCVIFVPDREPQKEFADYGNAGIVVNPYDVEGISKQLALVIGNPSQRCELALKGVQLYRNKFSQEIVRAKWRKVIDGLANL